MAGHSDSESDQDALEVEMQAVVGGDDAEDPPLPEIETAVQASRRNNRRARVEDDEDEERDRRHPSQRVTNPLESSSTNLLSTGKRVIQSLFDKENSKQE